MSMYAVKRSLSMDLVLIFSLDATYAHTPEGVWAAGGRYSGGAYILL